MQEQQHWESATQHASQLSGDDEISPNGHEPGDVVVDTGDEYLTIHAAARQAGVTRAAVLSWIRKGFIEARTSPDGWLIRSGDLEAARNAADDARFGFHVAPRDIERDTQVYQDVELVDERTTAIVSKAAISRSSPQPFNEHVFAPFAEFVRDQADVVQEQAETIGFLQAELRRARMQLSDTQGETHLDDNGADAEDHPGEAVEDPSPVVEEPDPFGDVQEWPHVFDHAVKADIDLDAIANDPSSDEAERARLLIEETERKIYQLWGDQQQSQARHASAPAQQNNGSWLRRLVPPWRH